MSRVDYLRLVLAIRRQLLRRDRVIVAIDGRCGSGKTTLAAKLQKQLHCSVFHMDDFSSVLSSGQRNGSPPPVRMWTTSGF